MSKYFTQIREVQTDMLEQTSLYFKCVKSMGTALFNFGNGIQTKHDVELVFDINCYVPSYVKVDLALRDEIVKTICLSIEESLDGEIISMMDIFKHVQENMSQYIDHISLLGMNGVSMNQTFSVMDKGIRPSIKRKLVLTDDNTVALEKQINVTFIAFENNLDSSVTVSV